MPRKLSSRLRNYRPSRRALLLGASAIGVGALAAASPFMLETSNKLNLIELILERNMPGVKMSDEDLAQFTASVFETMEYEKGVKDGQRFLAAADAARILDPATAFEMAGTRYDFDELEREVVTRFLLSTDFLDLDDPTETPITYVGYSPICGNPFASFVTAG